MAYDKSSVVNAANEGAKRYAPEELEVLKKFAAIDCGSRDEEGNKKVVAIIDELLGNIKGIEIEHVHAPGYGIHIVARLKPKNPQGKIILSAHTDTVFKPGDTAEHPFRIEGDTAYGLGIIDCKGGLVVSIYAVCAMQEAGMLPNKEIVFIFNCDEEIGSPTGKQVFDTIVPGAEMAFVFEPSRLEDGVVTARKGSSSILIDVAGVQAHSGVNYLDGRSAAVELCHRIIRMYESNLNERGIQFNVGEIKNFDPANIVSGHATANVSVRVSNQSDIETVKEIVERLNKEEPYLDGTTTTINIVSTSNPMERTEASGKVYEIVRDAGRLLGKELPEQATGGGSDGNYFSSKGVPTVDGLGPYMYKIHSFDESMRISSIEEKIALFGVVLGTLDS